MTPTSQNILIDGGNDNIDVLLPYLLDRRIKRIDYIIISHFDSDHCNGLIKILNNLNVKEIIISKQSQECQEFRTVLEIITKKGIPVRVVKRGDKISFDKYVYVEILAPEASLLYEDLNNNSIVAKLHYKDFSMLFTGDIQNEAENNLLKSKEDLSSIILKIAHHRCIKYK